MHLYFLLALLPSLISAHGYLSSPPPRGIQKEGYQVDDLKSPNFAHKLCRGEPVGKITKVTPGQSLKLGLTITAPHVGPCRVTIMDADLTNERPVAEKFNCAAPGGPGFWVIKLPGGLKGHKVLRWYWEGQHISTPGEPYEQCVDLDFGGSSDAPYEGEAEENESGDIPVGSQNHTPTPKPPVYQGGNAPLPPAPSRDGSSRGRDNNEGGYNGNDANDGYQGEEDTPRKPKKHTKKPKKSRSGNKKGDAYDPYSYSGSNNGGSGSCAAGTYQCTSNGGFRQCANGAWVKMQCPVGTACRQTGSTMVCDWTR